MLIRESCLVGVSVDDLDPDLTAPTVGPGGGDGVADAAIQQPAWTTLVQTLIPGGVELPRSGQGGVQFLTMLHCFLIGEAVVVTGEEDLTWRKEQTQLRTESSTHLIWDVTVFMLFTLESFYITKDVIKFIGRPRAIGPHPWKVEQVASAVISWRYDWIPEHDKEEGATNQGYG